METSHWEGNDYSQNFLAYQWKKLRTVPFWFFMLAMGPTLMWLFAMLALHKLALSAIPLLGSIGMIAGVTRAGVGKLKLGPELEEIFEQNPREAVPVQVEIQAQRMTVGEDVGFMLLKDDALTFSGERIHFVLYNDMPTSTERWLPNSGPLQKVYPNEFRLTFEESGQMLTANVRQRSFRDFSSDSDRIRRVVEDWLECDARRTLQPVLPPREPSRDARFSVISAYWYAAYSMVVAVVVWPIFAASATGEPGSPGTQLFFYVLATIVSASFLWACIASVKTAVKRRRFYDQSDRLVAG